MIHVVEKKPLFHASMWSHRADQDSQLSITYYTPYLSQNTDERLKPPIMAYNLREGSGIIFFLLVHINYYILNGNCGFFGAALLLKFCLNQLRTNFLLAWQLEVCWWVFHVPSHPLWLITMIFLVGWCKKPLTFKSKHTLQTLSYDFPTFI